jgi:small subunit ribosomal protein S16
MVKIRLFRTGTTKRPMYRIVAIESRRKRQGRVLHTLGTYNPCGGGAVTLDDAAVELWLSRGAQPSDTVRSLIRQHRRQAQASEAAGDETAPAASVETAASPESTESASPAS